MSKLERVLKEYNPITLLDKAIGKAYEACTTGLDKKREEEISYEERNRQLIRDFISIRVKSCIQELDEGVKEKRKRCDVDFLIGRSIGLCKYQQVVDSGYVGSREVLCNYKLEEEVLKK